MDGPASQLLAAISALYGPDPTQQQAANTWLNTFSKTPEAWAAALAVLDPANGAPTEAAFFCANLLLSKTRDEWGRLSPEHRVELADTYMCGAVSKRAGGGGMRTGVVGGRRDCAQAEHGLGALDGADECERNSLSATRESGGLLAACKAEGPCTSANAGAMRNPSTALQMRPVRQWLATQLCIRSSRQFTVTFASVPACRSRLRSMLPLPSSAAPALPLPPAVLLDRLALLAAATAALAGPGAAGRLMGLAVEAVRVSRGRGQVVVGRWQGGWWVRG